MEMNMFICSISLTVYIASYMQVMTSFSPCVRSHLCFGLGLSILQKCSVLKCSCFVYLLALAGNAGCDDGTRKGRVLSHHVIPKRQRYAGTYVRLV